MPNPQTQHIAIFKHGYLEAYLDEMISILKDIGHTAVVYDLVKGDSLPALQDLSGLIMMGGAVGAYDADEHPWLKAEKAWLKEAVQTDLPIFGICLGCQLLAEAFGGTVRKGEHGFSIGFREARLLVDNDPIFGSELKEKQVYAYHQDTYVLGNGQKLMQGVVYNEQAAKFKERVYGVQFHPEIKPSIIRLQRYLAPKYGIPKEKIPHFNEALAMAEEHIPEVQDWLKAFLRRLFS